MRRQSIATVSGFTETSRTASDKRQLQPDSINGIHSAINIISYSSSISVGYHLK